MIGAAPVSAAVSMISFPTLNARTLSYGKKALIVFKYRSRRLVVHAGEERSIEPLTGSDKSMLR